MSDPLKAQRAALQKNLKATRQLIEAELKDAKKGRAYWSQRVEQLTAARADLEAIETGNTAPAKAAKATKPVQALGVLKQEFWLSLLTDTPSSAAELAERGLAALSKRPTAEQAKAFKNRLYVALSQLARGGKLRSTGEGAARRYQRLPTAKARGNGRAQPAAESTPLH